MGPPNIIEQRNIVLMLSKKQGKVEGNLDEEDEKSEYVEFQWSNKTCNFIW